LCFGTAYVSSRCPSPDSLIKGGYVVISVPNDGEFYLGKRKVALSEIPDGVRKLFGNESLDNRVVFIKGAASVKFQTLSLIAGKIREADVNCIEFVLDKKKRGL
jgi:biopolymer transport protein ExbD